MQAIEQRANASRLVRQRAARHCCGAVGGWVNVMGNHLLDGCQPLLGRERDASEGVLDRFEAGPVVQRIDGALGVRLAGCPTHKVTDPAASEQNYRIAEFQ
ncbi:hypothetical protein QTI24_29780 [Variovorax sp. J22P240]|uniref:hypothetical protein n=1 Tax=Variovorax sp. J22P240 TaxID=3053514 RepID=UPI0025769187|nr:hypothetical protein [Variovorax sp. J22P240]MDM0002814.1 hypothetical protein [Variovorax sp. J22P240]